MTQLPNKLIYADDTTSGSGLQETKMRVNQLIDYLKEREVLDIAREVIINN